ncbi:MAG: hypothetical protein R3F62_00710 [Planctomycetota bacterium]
MSALDPGLREAVLRRLGFWEPPPATLDGLSRLYLEWCRGVPFDNVRKLTALFSRAEGELPGMDPSDFFRAWLDHGVGATCWPASHALATLLEDLGFQVSRGTASMLDQGAPNHGAPLVTVEGQTLWVDPAVLSERPVPLVPGRYGDALPFEVEEDARGVRLWFVPGVRAELFPCRLLERAAGFAAYAQGYEASRSSGPFNDRLYFRRNLPDRVVVLRGRVKTILDDRGVSAWELDEAELRKTLGRFGVSQELLEAFVASGALAATLAAEPQPLREFPERPPSER